MFVYFKVKVRQKPLLLNAKIIRPAEIHTQIVEVQGEGAVNKGNMRKWCRLFKEGRTKSA